MKTLNRPIPEVPIIKNINTPLLILDYGKHEKGIMNNADAEYEDTCTLKQGYLALVESVEAPNPESF